MTTRIPPICISCKHLRTFGPPQCDAFPDAIPQDIIENRADHRRPIAGDGGIQFEAKSKSAWTPADDSLYDKVLGTGTPGVAAG